MWTIAKSLGVPIDSRLNEIRDWPYTIAYVMRKRMQIDSLNELPEDKRPPEYMIWNGSVEQINSWIKKAIHIPVKDTQLIISEDDIEG